MQVNLVKDTAEEDSDASKSWKGHGRRRFQMQVNLGKDTAEEDFRCM
jgi:uncharacterized protein YukE